MKKLYLVFFLFFNSVSVFANEPKGADYSFNLEFGHRTDSLMWNIGDTNYVHTDANTYRPDILSELTWSDVESYYSKIEIYGEEGPYRLKINYLKSIDDIDGENQDSDYLYSGKQGEFSRSNNKTTGSEFSDYSISIGEEYSLSKNSSLIFWLGYEVNEQNFKIKNGKQTIGGNVDLSKLNSTYDSTFEGINFGFDYDYKFDPFSVKLNILYHYMEYEGKADWNLRTDLAHPLSHRDSLKGIDGFSYGVKFDYKINDSLNVFLNYDAIDYSGQDGTHTKYFTDGSIAKIKLQNVEWESQKLSLGITYKF